MTPIVEKIIERAKLSGIEASYWQKGDKHRIYAKAGRRDVKVFLELDDADATGAALKIFIDDCGQSPKWYASQRSALQENFKPLFLAYVVERYADAQPEGDPSDRKFIGFGIDISEMIAEAREYFLQIDRA